MNLDEGINVLSCFDGMSCGQIALERAGIKVNQYFASEIDKHAIKVTQYNYPNTVQLGSVTEVEAWMLPKIDLIIGGSPCQGFSFAGKMLNFEDPRSKLFFEFVRLLKEIRQENPDVKFLLENVRMKKDSEAIITELLGVPGVLLNSALISAQNRKRIYWTNISKLTAPADKGILLRDIVHARQYANWNGTFTFEELTKYIVPFDKTLQILDKEVEKGKVGFFKTDSKWNRVYYIHDKAVTLTGSGGGGATKMGQYLFGCISPDRIEKRQNGQRFSEGQKFYTLTAQDKHGILIEGYIRKLTPVECERLQTVEDGYTSAGGSVSDSQRYKMLGNGWTVDMAVHIFEGLHYSDF